MPLSRASTRASVYSQSSQAPSDHDVPETYPDTEAARTVSTQQNLSEAIHARRSEFTRPNTIRIKVGSWNVAGKKGTENDVVGWFMESKGVAEELTGLENTHLSQPHRGVDNTELPTKERRESVSEQESRVESEPKKTSTLPKHDHGEIPGYRDIGLYVLGLQEIVDISSATEAFRPYVDPGPANRWKTKIEEGLPSGYQLVAQQRLVGLMLLVYASPSVAPQISSVSTTTCSTGVAGLLGNKGAVTARIVLGETTRLIFINSHLSSGYGKGALDRRNWDATQITTRTQYDPIEDSLGYVSDRREKIGDEDFAFWCGDLNYRLEGIPGDDVRRLLMLHTRNEYDTSRESAITIERELAASSESVKSRQSQESQRTSSDLSPSSSTSSSSSKSSFDRSSIASVGNDGAGEDDDDDEALDPHSDPVHLQTTLNSLLSHDELHQQQRQRRMFHDGWREGPITFLPTYKYDVGSVGVFDSGDKKRGPSWCDRVLYRTRKDKTDYENMILEEQDAQSKDQEFNKNGMEEAADDENMLYDYDPEAAAEETGQDGIELGTGDEPIKMTTTEDFKDLIHLEYYVSHQRVLSSDHKPLDAVFKLEYDAVVPELKAKVHQDVARDLDRAENEARPVVTLIPDSQANGDGRSSEGIYFGDIHYQEEKHQTLTLANTGRATALFGFLSRQQADSSMSPTADWLSVSFDPPADGQERGASKLERPKQLEEWAVDVHEMYSLEPGGTCTIRCCAKVDKKKLAKRLNDGSVLDDVLILRIKEGRDHFIPVHATWLPTVFGRSITELIRLPEGGVRKLQRQTPHEDGNSKKRESAVISSAPKELFKLTRAIESLSERILAEWSMLQSNGGEEQEAPWVRDVGWPFQGWTLEFEKRRSLRIGIIEALDSDRAFDKVLDVDTAPLHRLEALADTLLLFVDSLADGVINAELWILLVQRFFTKERAKLKASRDNERAAILEILSASSPHSVSFVMLTSMLGSLSQEISINSKDNGATETPTSPILSRRRKTLSADPTIGHKQTVQKTYATIFAEPVIRSPDQANVKAQNAIIEQKREILEIFLDHGNEPG